MSAARAQAARFGPFGDRATVTFLTSALLVAGLGLLVAADHGPLPGDRAAAELAHSLRGDWMTDRMLALTDLGAGVTVAVLAVFAGLGLAANRKWNELAVTAIAAGLMLIAVPELKDGIGRDRPGGGLTAVESLSYPSGHAAHATWYLYLAILILHLAPPETRRRGLILAIGLVFCAAIGLSRVYLEVHYLSDVVGGWALGAACFTAWAVIARARERLRHNLSSDLPAGDMPPDRG